MSVTFPISLHRPALLLGAALTALVAAAPAGAVTIWTNWTAFSAGAPGSASGSLNGNAISFSGQVLSNSVVNGLASNWAPNSSFIGGTVTASPSVVGDIITQNGIGFTGINTLTFATPVTDPVFAIWSLGQPGAATSYTFNATPTLEAGGPNAQFGGSSISAMGNVVSGSEGNGVVQFTGTFSALNWILSPENYYGFTVGVASDVVVQPPTATPEPASLAVLGVALLGLATRRRRASS